MNVCNKIQNDCTTTQSSTWCGSVYVGIRLWMGQQELSSLSFATITLSHHSCSNTLYYTDIHIIHADYCHASAWFPPIITCVHLSLYWTQYLNWELSHKPWHVIRWHMPAHGHETAGCYHEPWCIVICACDIHVVRLHVSQHTRCALLKYTDSITYQCPHVILARVPLRESVLQLQFTTM